MTLKDRWNKLKDNNKPNSKKFLSDAELIELMKNIDLLTVLSSLGISVKKTGKKDEYTGFCPDHALYKGVDPSHPKWYINAKSGKSFCYTESRASNIVEIAKNLLGLNSLGEALDKLLDGKELNVVPIPKIAQKTEEVLPTDEDEKRRIKHLQCLAIAKKVFANKVMNKECLTYFAKDGITEDTLNKFGIAVCEDGSYKDRAMLPFVNELNELKGFIAIDYLGKDEWIKRRKNEYWKLIGYQASMEAELTAFLENEYKKTLYCPGWHSSEHIFGYYENPDYKKGVDYLVLVEGERDALKLMQEGIPCVSIHGTVLQPQHLNMIKILSPNLVYLGFDMDDAGNKAVANALKLLHGQIDQVFVLNFPNNQDPKKFQRSELLSFMELSKKNNIKSRSVYESSTADGI